jgi:hypothetical protein
MIVYLKFEQIPISGNEYAKWTGRAGYGKRLIHGKVRFPKSWESRALYPTLREYLETWRALCRIAWHQAGEPVFAGSVLITPKLWRWNGSAYYDSTNLWEGMKPIEDMLTKPSIKQKRRKFGLAMIADDRHNQVYHGHPEWIKPGLDDDKDDRMILLIEDYEPPDKWGRDKFVSVWNGGEV